MLLQESRRRARTTAAGDLVLLEDQDRATWDAGLIAEGWRLAARAVRGGPAGVYPLQAAIAAEHAAAPTAAATDWRRIAALYDALHAANPSPVVELNRAVAVAMRDGPAAGLALIDGILARGDLTDYQPRPTRPGPTCSAASAAATTPAPLTSKPCCWRGRSRSGGSCRSGCPNSDGCAGYTSAADDPRSGIIPPAVSIRGRPVRLSHVPAKPQ